ncbi:MAG: VOC family protein [Chloroflexia bacterium]
MKLSCVRMLVDDFSTELKFYREVMQLVEKYVDEKIHYAYLGFDASDPDGSTCLELADLKDFAEIIGDSSGALPATKLGGTLLNIKVDDVDASYAEFVGRGAKSLAEPKDRPDWGVRAAHLADPEGNILEIYTSLPSAEQS